MKFGRPCRKPTTFVISVPSAAMYPVGRLLEPPTRLQGVAGVEALSLGSRSRPGGWEEDGELERSPRSLVNVIRVIDACGRLPDWGKYSIQISCHIHRTYWTEGSARQVGAPTSQTEHRPLSWGPRPGSLIPGWPHTIEATLCTLSRLNTLESGPNPSALPCPSFAPLVLIGRAPTKLCLTVFP